MTDSTSSFDPPPPPPGTNPPPAPPPPSGEGPTKRRKLPLVIAGVAVVVLVVAAAGAVALQKLSGGGAQPHDVLPADTSAYVRIDLDPSASQKIKLLRLLRRVPDFTEATGISSDKEDIRKALVTEIFSGQCVTDYDKQVKPWIGERAAAAYGPGAASQGVLVLGVSNEGKAKKGLTDLLTCLKVGEFDIAFSDGYALVTAKEGAATEIAAAGKKSPLADAPVFKADMDTLGEQGVASAWVDVPAVVATAGDQVGMGAADVQGIDKLTSFTAALRAGSSTIELVGNVHHDGSVDTKAATDLGDLPADTLFAAGGSGGGEQVTKNWPQLQQQLSAQGIDLTQGLSSFTEQTGLVLPDDLATLLGDDLTVAMGSKGLESLDSISGPSSLSQIDLGLVLSTDPAKAKDLVARISQNLLAPLGVSLATADRADGLAVSTNQAHADALAGDGGLADEEAYKKAFDVKGPTVAALFVNFDKISEAMKASGTPDDLPDAEQLEPFQAFGFWAGPDGAERTTFVARVAFD